MVKYCSILLVKDDEQDEYQKYLLFILLAHVPLFLFLLLFLLPLKSIDSRSYEVLHTISQYGVITNKDEWRNILELTRYGRKVTNVDNLNTLVYVVNKT